MRLGFRGAGITCPTLWAKEVTLHLTCGQAVYFINSEERYTNRRLGHSMA